MARQQNENIAASQVLAILWRDWAFALGALNVPLLAALFVPRICLPFICFFVAWALASIGKASPPVSSNSSSLLIRVVSRVLLFSTVVMFAIVILCTDWLVPTVIHLQLYNSEIPFITSLVIFPITTVVCLVWLYGGLAQSFIRASQRRNGYYAGDNILATLYYRETRYQVCILLILSVVIGAVEYWYYFARYINSDLNDPDRFFFNYIPLVMYGLSLLFIGGRYTSMKVLYDSMENRHEGQRNRTVVRFLIFCADELLLHLGTDSLWDTPVEVAVARTSSLGKPQAELLFEEATGNQAPAMRYCFTNTGFATGSNMVHYAVFVDPAERELFTKDFVWFNPYALDSALSTNSLSQTLANELYRIHTITMAWKTYDRNGRRLYPIRHYRPTFRLRDLSEWTVDYDDQSWFDIAQNNEDRRFFRLRNFWNNITGFLSHKARVGQ